MGPASGRRGEKTGVAASLQLFAARLCLSQVRGSPSHQRIFKETRHGDAPIGGGRVGFFFGSEPVTERKGCLRHLVWLRGEVSGGSVNMGGCTGAKCTSGVYRTRYDDMSAPRPTHSHSLTPSLPLSRPSPPTPMPLTPTVKYTTTNQYIATLTSPLAPPLPRSL